MTDEIAKLYIRYSGDRYLIKVFPRMVSIERQPGGETLLLDKTLYRDAGKVLAGGLTWNYEALTQLLQHYPEYEPSLVCALCGHELYEGGGCTNRICANFYR